MTRKFAFRLALVATPLLAGAAWILLNWYEIETKPTRSGYSKEAIRDPFLAYTRLLDRLGTPKVVARLPSQLDSLPDKGVLMLGRLRLVHMTPRRIASLESWVRNGGVLIAAAELRGIDDPLLAHFDIARVELPKDEARTKADEKAAAKRRSSEERGRADIYWPGASRALRVRMNGPSLRHTREGPISDSVSHLRGDKAVVITRRMGEGVVIALSDLDFLSNRNIGNVNFDHAEFGALLASASETGRPAMLFMGAEDPSLADWLVDNTWPLIVAATLALLAWIARQMARFGPLAPEHEPVRRSLVEHLRANGRFLWSRGAAAALVEALRERVWRTASRRRAGFSDTGNPAARHLLAEVSRTPTATVELAFQGATRSASDFIATATALQTVERGLARRPTARHSRKEDSPR